MTDFKALLRTLVEGGVDRLIEVKRAAGRPKDLEALAELETIRDEGSTDPRRG
jgi:hypothetical protein